MEITFREVAKSDDIEQLIREKAAKLEKVCDAIISCRVAVESPHAHRHSGNPFRVCISLRVPPGRELYFHRNSVLNDDFDRLQIGTGCVTSPKQAMKVPRPPRFKLWTSRGSSAVDSD